MFRLFRGARLGPRVGMAPPSAPLRDGAGLDHVGEALRTTYPEEEPENLDGRLTALMLQLSIDPPENQTPVTPPRHGWAEARTALANISRKCWAAIMRRAGVSFRRRVR